jgi:valyl-tRNA synthetase
MYHFKYQVTNTNEFIKVATTRPETMFVDVAVFVNPNDERYKKYINMQVINPINDKLIPILTDTYVDSSFGTGAMKCTPAHDFNDYKLAIKYQIECYQSVINQDGTLNENANLGEISLKGIDRLQARNKIVEYIKSKGLLIKTEDYENEIGYSERTGEIVEPLLSEQWFVKMKPLAKQTIVLIKKQKPEFIPLRFEKTMQQWLNNIED